MEEGLTEHIRRIYIQSNFGADSAKSLLVRDSLQYAKIANSDSDIPILSIRFPNTPDMGTIVYKRTPYLLDKFRNRIGHETWDDLIKSIYSEFNGKMFTYNDFEKMLFEKVKDDSIIADWKNAFSE